MIDDSLKRSIDLLKGEIEEIDRAVVRLDARREKLEGAVRLLEEQVVGLGSESPRPEPQEEPKPEEPGPTELVREFFDLNPDGWFTAADVRKATGLSSKDIGTPLSYMSNHDQLDTRPINSGESWTPGQAKWEYRKYLPNRPWVPRAVEG